MEKITGQKILDDLRTYNRKVQNLHVKANKRFIMILDNYQEYIPEKYKKFLQENSYLDMNTSTRLEIVIATEAEYVKRNSNQKDLFE